MNPSKMKKHSIDRIRENIVKIGSQQGQRKRKPATRGSDNSHPNKFRGKIGPDIKSVGTGQPLSMRNYKVNGLTLDKHNGGITPNQAVHPNFYDPFPNIYQVNSLQHPKSDKDAADKFASIERNMVTDGMPSKDHEVYPASSETKQTSIS